MLRQIPVDLELLRRHKLGNRLESILNHLSEFTLQVPSETPLVIPKMTSLFYIQC